jgi:putative acetyltransferase
MNLGDAQLSDFEPNDQDEVRSLILAGLGEHWGHVDESLNPDLVDIRASYGHGRTLVVRLADSGPIIATGTIVPRDATTAEILRMSIAPEHRRLGLGRRLVDELVMTAEGWGATAVVLETSSHWHEVVAFYQSCGFAITHQRTGPFGQDTWFLRKL